MEKQIKDWVREHCPAVTRCDVELQEPGVEEPFYRVSVTRDGKRYWANYWIPAGLLRRRGLDAVLLDTLSHEVIPAGSAPGEPERSIHLWLHAHYKECVVSTVETLPDGWYQVTFTPYPDGGVCVIFISQSTIAELGLAQAMRRACGI